MTVLVGGRRHMPRPSINNDVGRAGVVCGAGSDRYAGGKRDEDMKSVECLTASEGEFSGDIESCSRRVVRGACTCGGFDGRGD